jgi:uncharacterized protein with HEPN domain
MPPTLADRVQHILEAIGHIERALAGVSYEEFVNDLFLRLAIERLLEVISEASRNIPADVKANEAGIAWQKMVDLGNRLRHAYHRVDPGILWQIAKNDLPPLRNFVEGILRQAKK